MYLPQQFEETDLAVMQDLIHTYPLATLILQGGSRLNANHIPLQFCPSPPYGCLHGHIARANPLATELAASGEALAIFHGPNAYISPAWYASKQTTTKVVPTWNYAVVHAYGKLRLVEDGQWLREQLRAFTEKNEADLPEPWALDDAPAEFIEQIMAGIVGVEMVITELQGKWKVSQNQPASNQASVVAGLRTSTQWSANAMADWVEAKIKPAR